MLLLELAKKLWEELGAIPMDVASRMLSVGIDVDAVERRWWAGRA
jgi:hypothetical protein